ncbi:hypothetical protein [Brevundimonas sp.]|uniref:hypothetical protein n=1 Tax=Brevundimonas sp. TaxID=1871086 RepID=UPI0028986419|nr:hypothetical protein [Brevundimonas sp.]
MKDKIPTAVIGLLSNIYPDYFTHNQIDSLFLTAGAPDEIPEGSKPVKVKEWLRQINKISDNPNEILGRILEEFFELTDPSWMDVSGEWKYKHDKAKASIQEALGSGPIDLRRAI